MDASSLDVSIQVTWSHQSLLVTYLTIPYSNQIHCLNGNPLYSKFTGKNNGHPSMCAIGHFQWTSILLGATDSFDMQ